MRGRTVVFNPEMPMPARRRAGEPGSTPCPLSDAPLLRRTAAVVRDRRDVRDRQDLDAERVQRPHRGLATRAGALDLDLQVLDAAVLGGTAGGVGRDLGGERRRLARALEAGATGRRPGERVALAVGDRDDRVVEGRMDVRDAIRNVLLDLLADALGALRATCHGCVLRLLLQCHASATRPLAGARVGAGALAARGQAAAMTHPAVAAEVHQSLDRHGHFAPQVALDGELADAVAQALELGVAEVPDLLVERNPRRFADRAGAS